MTKGFEFACFQAEQGLKLYFPHAHAVVSGSMPLGLTCADLGPAAIHDLPTSLDNNASVQQLKKFGGFLGIQSFARGFPEAILQLDLSTKQYRLLSPNPISGYAGMYATTCNVPSPEVLFAPTMAATTNTATVYVGTFRATVTQNGAQQIHTATDALGVYTPADFERAKPAELAAREQIIRQEFARRGVMLNNLDLVGVKTTRIPQ